MLRAPSNNLSLVSLLEFGCLPYGFIYYVTIPSMYLLLVIFSIYNLNDVSWGTREVAADAVSIKQIIKCVSSFNTQNDLFVIQNIVVNI